MRSVLGEQLFLGPRLSCGRVMWSLQSISNAFQMAAQQAGRLGLLPPPPGQSESESLGSDSHHLALPPRTPSCLVGRLALEWSFVIAAQQAPPGPTQPAGLSCQHLPEPQNPPWHNSHSVLEKETENRLT